MVAVFFLFSKTQTMAQSERRFTIKGVIDTIPHASYFIYYSSKGLKKEDSITLNASSEFEYTGKITEPTILHLTIKNTINSRTTGNTYVYSFWIEPEKIIIFTGKTGWLTKGLYGLAANPKKFQLTNSSIETIENNYNKTYKEIFNKWNRNTKKSINPNQWTQISDSIKVDFINKHPKNYYSLYLINNDLKQNNPNYLAAELLLNKLSKKVKNTYLGRETEDRIRIHRTTTPGMILPDFKQRDTLSKPVKLSSLRGKYVLVDFWASWCAPCRKENPYLVEAYKKYSSKGFEILGVSVDQYKKNWMKAIHQDQLPWIHVSDLKGFDNEVAKSLFIHAVPDNFLLDPNGVIIARKLSGKELLQKLNNLL